jgi:long-chain acyl-CoA synthetase
LNKIKTIYDLYSSIKELYKDKYFLTYKEKNSWVKLTANQAINRVNKLALGLDFLGFKQGDKISIVSETRYEWSLLDLAIEIMGMISVPVYPTITTDQMKYIIDHSDSKAIIASNKKILNNLLEYKNEMQIDKYFIMDGESNESENVLSIAELEKIGSKVIEAEGTDKIEIVGNSIKEEELASIIYTSGTTGTPKGVMLSHRNFISNCYGSNERVDLTICDNSLIFLPLSHSYARTTTYSLMMGGVTLWYSEGVSYLGKEFTECKPDIITVVPRLLENIYDKTISSASRMPFLSRKLFIWSIKLARDIVEKQQSNKKISIMKKLKYKIADKLIYKKIRDKVGGRLKFVISGSSALAKNISEFFNGIKIPVIEGYGLTEASPMVSGNSITLNKIGTIGYPYFNVKVKLGKDNELLVKGPSVMMGYYKDEETTKATLTDDGWLKTGDICVMDEDNYITIVDRKKDLIKTSGGKYIIPQKIENIAKQNSYISEFVVVGEKKKFASAIILPNFDNIKKTAVTKSIKFKTIEDLIKNINIIDLFQGIIDTINKQLANFEKIKKFILVSNPFTIDNGKLTPTLKVIRKVILNEYKKEIAVLYKQ